MADSTFLSGYDTAVKAVIYSKFSSILGFAETSDEEVNISNNVLQYPKEIALRKRAEKQVQDFLEFANIWRTGVSFDWNRQSTRAARTGLWLSVSDDSLETVHVKGVPVNISYNVWFWSKSLDKINKCIEEYTFWQQDNPQLSILYNDKYTLEPDIHFGEVLDESTIPEEFEKGIIFCYRVPIKVDGWVLKSTAFKTIHKIIVTVYDKDEISAYSQIIGDEADPELEAVLRLFRRVLYHIYSISLAANSITLSKDFSSDFAIGSKFQIVNSDDNNGVYTISGISTVSGKTVITVLENLQSETVTGSIYKAD